MTVIIGCDSIHKLLIFVLPIEGDSQKLCLQKYGTTTGNTVSVCNNWFPTTRYTLFGGRSPACSQSFKIVRLPPSGMGVCSAICVYKWRTKQWSHNMHLLKSTPMLTSICSRLSKVLYFLLHKQPGHLSYHSQHQMLWTNYVTYTRATRSKFRLVKIFMSTKSRFTVFSIVKSKS